MTTYHRFFVPSGAKINISDLSEIVSRAGNHFQLEDGLVTANGEDVGLLEVTVRGDAFFSDDLDLTLRLAKKQKLSVEQISMLSDSSSFILFQPVGGEAGKFQSLLWPSLFKQCKDAILVFDGGAFQFEAQQT